MKMTQSLETQILVQQSSLISFNSALSQGEQSESSHPSQQTTLKQVCSTFRIVVVAVERKFFLFHLSPLVRSISRHLRWKHASLEWKVVVFFSPSFFSFPFDVVSYYVLLLFILSVTTSKERDSFVFLAFFFLMIHPSILRIRPLEKVQSSLLGRSSPVRVSRVTL